MRKSCDENRGSEPLLRIECLMTANGRTRTYTITVGTSAIAIVLILVGSRVWPFQDVLHAVMKLVVPN